MMILSKGKLYPYLRQVASIRISSTGSGGSGIEKRLARIVEEAKKEGEVV